MRKVSVVLAVACVSWPALAATTITNLGFVSGSHFTLPLGISDDGKSITGEADTPTADTAFLWTRSGGIQNIGNPSGGNDGYAYGISGDGSIIAGVEFTDTDHAYRWTSSGGFQDIGKPANTTGAGANAISRDGSTIVGQADTDTGIVAFRWTSGTGSQSLGTLPGGEGGTSFALGANANGSVVVGQSNSALGLHGFRWTTAGMQDLGILGNGVESTATATNADGSVVAGYTVLAYFPFKAHATRWTSAGLQDLGTFAGANFSVVDALNSDGSILVGASGSANYDAMLWTPSLGMVDLNNYLPTLGVDLTGWDLHEAHVISADGSTIAGTGTFNGENAAWVISGVSVPEPCAFSLLVLASAVRLNVRKRAHY